MDRNPIPDGHIGDEQAWQELERHCFPPPKPEPKPEPSIWWRIFWWPLSPFRSRKH